jgi:hypothetical protein
MLSADKKADLTTPKAGMNNALGDVKNTQADFKTKFEGVKAALGQQIVHEAHGMGIHPRDALQTLMPVPNTSTMLSVVADFGINAVTGAASGHALTVMNEVMSQPRLSAAKAAKLWDKVKDNIRSDGPGHGPALLLPHLGRDEKADPAAHAALKKLSDGQLKSLAMQSAEQQPEFKALDDVRVGLEQGLDNQARVEKNYDAIYDASKLPEIAGNEAMRRSFENSPPAVAEIVAEITETPVQTMERQAETLKDLPGRVDHEADLKISGMKARAQDVSGIGELAREINSSMKGKAEPAAKAEARTAPVVPKTPGLPTVPPEWRGDASSREA